MGFGDGMKGVGGRGRGERQERVGFREGTGGVGRVFGRGGGGVERNVDEVLKAVLVRDVSVVMVGEFCTSYCKAQLNTALTPSPLASLCYSARAGAAAVGPRQIAGPRSGIN